MILPTGHLRTERVLIGVGAELLGLLKEPVTVSRLWDALREQQSGESPNAPISYAWFVLALDFLFLIGAIETKRGLIVRAVP